MARSPEDEEFVAKVQKTADRHIGRVFAGFVELARTSDWCDHHQRQATEAVIEVIGIHTGWMFARAAVYEGVPRKALIVLMNGVLQGMDEFVERHRETCRHRPVSECPVEKRVRASRDRLTPMMATLTGVDKALFTPS